MCAYLLDLTEQDVDTISAVGPCFNWTAALWHFDEGEHVLTESEAWELVQAFYADLDEDNGPFPRLDPTSELACKLCELWTEVV